MSNGESSASKITMKASIDLAAKLIGIAAVSAIALMWNRQEEQADKHDKLEDRVLIMEEDKSHEYELKMHSLEAHPRKK